MFSNFSATLAKASWADMSSTFLQPDKITSHVPNVSEQLEKHTD